MGEDQFLAAAKKQAKLVHHLRIGGSALSIAVNHPTLSARVSRYFSPFIDQPAADAFWVVGLHGMEAHLDRDRLRQLQHHSGRPKEAYYDVDGLRVVLKNRTGVVHYLSANHFYAVGDLLRFSRQLLNLVSAAYAYSLREKGYLALHASGVSTRGLGTAFAANSGSGKSSVALQLMERGNDFVSNDRVYLKRDGGVVGMAGVPKWPRVNPGTLLSIGRLQGLLEEPKRRKYSAMPPEDLWAVEDKHDVRVDSIYGRGKVALRSRLRELYVLNWRHRVEKMEIVPTNPKDFSSLIMPLTKTSVYDPPWVGLPGEEWLKDVFQGVSVYEVRGGLEISGLVDRVQESLSARLMDISR